MKTLVLVKQVPDSNAVRMDETTGTMVRHSAEAVVNPLDLYAVEAALCLRERYGGEVVALGCGDIVVQRGTNHLWRNPSSDENCRIAFVLIQAEPVIVDGRVLEEVHP